MWSVIKRGYRSETRRKILRCLFLKRPSNVLTGIYIYIYIYIHNSEIWILRKTLSQKFGFIIKTCYFHVYTLDCNVPWIYKHKLLSFSNLHFATILPTSPFFGEKNVPYPIFWRINRTPIPIPFVKRERDPAMINQNYLFHIFVTKNRSSNNKNIEFQIWECVIY